MVCESISIRLNPPTDHPTASTMLFMGTSAAPLKF
jgi:hypothetical protein